MLKWLAAVSKKAFSLLGGVYNNGQGDVITLYEMRVYSRRQALFVRQQHCGALPRFLVLLRELRGVCHL